MTSNPQPTLYFDGGTLVLNHIPREERQPDPFQWVKYRWRCEAYHYPQLKDWLRENQIRDTVPRWERLKLVLQGDRQPHDYQTAGLTAWNQGDRRGTVVLPTGAGKTFLAIQAIALVQRSTVIVAPTIDLLHQWYARLNHAFSTEVGLYFGREKSVMPLTVTTYHSAGDLIADFGNRFKFLIYDEVHHLPAPHWGETALMAPAPFRLGLTATYPDEGDRPPDRPPNQEQVIHEERAIYTVQRPVQNRRGQWQISQLIGPVVYQQHINELVGQQLADYRTMRIRVELTPAERTAYDQAYAVYGGYFRQHALPRRYGPGWLAELLRRSAFDEDARRAVLARQQIQQLLAAAENKLVMVAQLLQEHPQEKVLIFTENNDVVYQLSRRFLIPAITHETRPPERLHILDGFRGERYRAIVTSKVLNEGIDVPEAKVALVLGGTAGAREYVQRLGRVLRKVGQQQATLYEIIARNTVDEGRAQRRRPAAVRQKKSGPKK